MRRAAGRARNCRVFGEGARNGINIDDQPHIDQLACYFTPNDGGATDMWAKSVSVSAALHIVLRLKLTNESVVRMANAKCSVKGCREPAIFEVRLYDPFRYAVLFSLTVAFPAAAQTTAAPGTVTVNGVVNLGTSNPTASTTTAKPAAAVPSTSAASPVATIGGAGAVSTGPVSTGPVSTGPVSTGSPTSTARASTALPS